MKSLDIAVVSTVAVLLLVPTVLSATPCTPGDKLTVDCNNCLCTKYGLAACTRWICNSFHTGMDEKQECVPGTNWKEDCNTCFCTGKGWAACTRMGCPSDREKRSIKNNKKKCMPGTVWKEECNTCYCNLKGRKECTMMACPPPPHWK